MIQPNRIGNCARCAGFRVSGLGLEEEKVGCGGAGRVSGNWGNREISGCRINRDISRTIVKEKEVGEKMS